MMAYREVGFIAHGAFASVVKVERKSDHKIFACKSVSIDEKKRKGNLRYARREADILSTLQHPNIAKLIDVEWYETQLKIYMDYYTHGTLDHLIVERRDVLGNLHLEEPRVWTILWQLSNALVYCHEGKLVLPDNTEKREHSICVLHRDIKPPNIFLSNLSETAVDNIRLGDFGLGVVVSEDHDPYTYVGTKCYKPPEISRKKSVIKWNTTCDIFSLGCTLYEMCNLTPAYPDPMESDQLPAEWQEPDIYSVKLQRCIRACINANPTVRPRARDLSLLAYDEIKGAPQIKAALDDIALLQAAGAGDFDSAVELLQQGADPKARDLYTQETAFHFVVKSDCLALIPLLVGHGMMNEKNSQGETPLHCAAVSGSGAMTSALLNQGADRLERHNDAFLPMHRAAKAGNDEALRELLDQSADEIDLRTQSDEKLTALHLAAASGSDSCVRLLIDRGANIEAELDDGATAFYLASRNGHLAVLQILAQAKCNKDKLVKGSRGNTALLRASDRGQFEVAENLIELGCDAHALSSDGLKGLHLAAREGHSRIVDLLINADVDLEATSNIEGQEGWTALHMAVSKPHLLVTQVLIDAGSCLEARTLVGNTALLEAIIAKQFEMMKLLLAQGSDVNAKGMAGVTALHLSAAADDVESVQILLEHQAKIDTVTKDGLTSLSIAAWCGRLTVVRVLIEHGAKIDVRDMHGQSALELARASNHEDVVELLIESGASDKKSLIHRTSDTLRYFLTSFV